MRRATLLALTAAAACVAFGVAAPLSAAKVSGYEGPVDLPLAAPDNEGDAPPPATIKFRAGFDGKKLKDVFLLSEDGIYQTCTSSAGSSISYYPHGSNFEGNLKVNKRQFSGTWRVGVGDEFEEWVVTGKVARNGTASGTVRITSNLVFSGVLKQCDTGVLSWTATSK